jgi:putative membrane protein
MRKVFGGLVLVLGLGAVCLAQDNNAAARAGAGGQGITGQVNQGQTTQGQPGQVQPGQGQFRAGQPGQVVQPAQPGQANQFNQNQFGQIQPGQQGRQDQAAHSDQEIAACISFECANEIAVAKLAEQKAQSDEVKKFAQQMVRDHSPGCQEMQQLAGQLLNQGQQNRGEQGGRLDWVSIHKQVADQCLATVKEELSNKSSQEFDHCFMGQQIGAHMKVVDSLKVLRNYASNDLRQKLDKELETAQHHLQMAKKIEEGLKGESSQRLSRRPGDSSK